MPKDYKISVRIDGDIDNYLVAESAIRGTTKSEIVYEIIKEKKEGVYSKSKIEELISDKVDKIMIEKVDKTIEEKIDKELRIMIKCLTNLIDEKMNLKNEPKTIQVQKPQEKEPHEKVINFDFLK